MLQLRKEAPFRPTDWRWQMARLLREQSRRVSRRRVDEWVALAKRFQAGQLLCRTDWDALDLAERYPGIADARYLRDETGVQAHRWEIEARLLADDTPENIGRRLCIDPRAVMAYEALFFNVSDRLHHQGWIVHSVMGTSIHAGLNERQFDLLWKLYGFFGGPHVLDALINTFSGAPKATGPDQVGNYFSDDARGTVRRKSAIAARTMPVNGYTQQIILEIEQKYHEIEKISSGTGQAGMLTDMVGEVMKGLAWSVGRGTPDRPIHVMTAKADTFAAEPRIGELLALASGRTDDLDELETITFPEATNVANR